MESTGHIFHDQSLEEYSSDHLHVPLDKYPQDGGYQHKPLDGNTHIDANCNASAEPAASTSTSINQDISNGPMNMDSWLTAFVDDMIFDDGMNFGITRPPEVTIDSKTLGERPMVQTFFEGPPKCQCCINWIEREPAQVPQVAQDKYDGAAIQTYKTKDHGNKETLGGIIPFRYRSMEIQSMSLRKILKPLLAKQGLFIEEHSKLILQAPFKELYFCYEKIRQTAQDFDPTSTDRQYLEVLVKTMNAVFGEILRGVSDLHAKASITYEHYWTLFAVGMLVCTQTDGHERVLQVIKVATESLRCHYVQFDGMEYGLQEILISLPKFQGSRKISELSVHPIAYTEKGIEQRLLERAENILQYQNWKYVLAKDDNGLEGNLYNRVVIDALVYHRRHPGDLNMRKLARKSTISRLSRLNDNVDEQDEEDEADEEDVIDSDDEFVEKWGGDIERVTSSQQKRNCELVRSRRQLMLLLDPFLPGCCPKSGFWSMYCVSDLKPIDWNESAFDRLVLDENKKNLLLSFTKNHAFAEQKSAQDIKGKGQGLNILLSGPPGTGKTFTAESIADKIRRPLCYVHFERLGHDSVTIGNRLSNMLELVQAWGGILLLDEADVLISRRSFTGNSRNDLVAVMLRKIEYHKSILVLTTNLLETIDDALRSRIQIHLCYPSLSFDSRRTLWKRLLKWDLLGIGKPSMSRNADAPPDATYNIDSILDRVSLWELNGREINNAAKTANLWCSYQEQRLCLDWIESALQVTAPFATKIDAATVEDHSYAKRRRL